MKSYFSFCHDYYKLQERRFTTIRGKSAVKYYKEGQIVDIIKSGELPSGGAGKVLFQAKITMIIQIRLSGLCLSFLEDDANYPGFQVKSHAEFIGLLNSFRKYEQSKIKTTDPEVTVIYLERI